MLPTSVEFWHRLDAVRGGMVFLAAILNHLSFYLFFSFHFQQCEAQLGSHKFGQVGLVCVPVLNEVQ